MSEKMKSEIKDWIVIILIGLVVFFIFNRFIAFNISSPTPSMENTFMVGDKVFVSRLSYLFHDPKRGDIVVFEAPDEPEKDYIKRIIGLPGETIEGYEGVVYINGEPLKEEYLWEEMEGDFGPFVIPEDSYFMMGDNRNSSLDARFWENTYVTQDKFKGKAILKYPDFAWLNKVKY